eukprot:gnl/TRDRNA2_/TRDRNA2_137783_c0_seq1.p1 gnl/TRDRNA2_/TRDRNA2_137783_c0~~gnl/TRDRNA2_/TRDRNA2_137783_c0_seq1.p1  ORF type:complete len:252 (-),score=20.94 gnl/TRDRNA2_/TRDRNA2_137783_c0_seq1:296-1051(-)
MDPREPEPSWYHRHHGRSEVAKTISEWRSAHLQALRSQYDPPSRSLSESPRKTAVPALSAAELKDAQDKWRLSAARAADLLCRTARASLSWSISLPLDVPQRMDDDCATIGALIANLESLSMLEATTVGEKDCDECLRADALPAPISQPTVYEGDAEYSCSICLAALVATDPLMLLPCGPKHALTSHIFHASCLGNWLLKKGCCPVCRCDVRPMLRERRHHATGHCIRPIDLRPAWNDTPLTERIFGKKAR